jgi:hypothetical protein
VSDLHIVQGGIGNGDKAWLEKAARRRLSSQSWITPKLAKVGDEVVIFISGDGFFATARIGSLPKRRTDWKNRYGACLTSIRLIQPPISLGVIRRKIPALTWAKYPRSITTPSSKIAEKIRTLIARRRKTDISDLDVTALKVANMAELRKAALLKARSDSTPKERRAVYHTRSLAVRYYIMFRANGYCEGCGAPAPFHRADGSPYLEPHHTLRRADGGPDHPARVIALCPNCHRRAHCARDAKSFNDLLKRALATKEHLPHA